MNDQIFAEMARQMKPDDQVRGQLLARLTAPVSPPVRQVTRHRYRNAWLAVAACLAAFASGTLLPGAIGHGRPLEIGDPPAAVPPAPAPSPGASTPVPRLPAGAAAGGYAELYAAVSRASSGWQTGLYNDVGGPARAASSAPFAAADSARSGAYQTNSQVMGIDEGDVVKSDGETLFLASGNQVVILAAAGAATREIGRIDTAAGPAAASSAGRGDYVGQGPVADLMLYEDTLVVLVTQYEGTPGALPASDISTYLPLDAALTKALFYDVSDPAAPRYLSTLGQSGAVVTSRLLDGILYLVTEYLVADPAQISPTDPETFVPVITDGASRALVPAPDCFPMPYADGPRYAVASSIDLATRSRIDTEAVLGGSQTVYMSAENLFLASTDYSGSLSPAQGKAARVDDLKLATVPATHLARIRLDAGQLSLGAEATVPGQLINQFALDEYEGHLRVAVTVSGEDKTYRSSWAVRPALYVLDSKLRMVGSLPNLAQNESVESVRFDGPVGYVVSFERRDPLFAIDLAKPTKPKVMSALKIPGFSTYLDLWADSRLLGLGIAANDDGTVTGMKLSMFDTSDPFEVSELTTQKVEFDDSEALWNHKAVLVDRERGLIGFPATSWREDTLEVSYLVYRYHESTGFKLAKKLPARVADQYNPTGVRGLRIEGFLYVTSAKGVEVYAADGFGEVKALEIG